MASSTSSKPACKNLVLDAGPLLSLSPLRGLAETYYTVPQVLDELKDKRAREHFEKLGLSAGVRIQVQSPDAQSVAHVIQFAKKTGDYAVLSTADLAILALTYSLEEQEKKRAQDSAGEASAAAPPSSVSNDTPEAHPEPVPADEAEDEELSEAEEPPASDTASDTNSAVDEAEQEPLDVKLQRVEESHSAPADAQVSTSSSAQPTPNEAEEALLYDDPSDEEDVEGEWITPSNVALHKSRALHLLPDEAGKAGRKAEQIKAGCMTADFAMQNVLLQMGLSLVSVDGKKIERVKTWVLRCHACFKICKDSSRKFCPSCGNPTLIRASVTLSSPNADKSTPTLQVHLKKNFQFKTRGTKYSIPAPKPGNAKMGAGEGLILREDQTAWVRAKKIADGKREREEKRMLSGTANNKGESAGVVMGSWMDPDWVPEMLSVGAGGKGRSMRSSRMDGDMPVIGYGRKNPNERRRRK
ncbi:hypothetical protein NM688_g1865 [Phlebia brevispora]|uniref:Uncharacterized protein n=1 Tax=Phlebia brevispora TaxID=194682 RepID=A0ACC1TA44_9APHY|nr:hypothetical protein NM688_g1865 [Phlebia brevispora]